ncbi:MAG: NCS2 family permease [Verrucomicrobia bacterium]|nr:NCS2 family permease [Verrucomicrobiota bacterium]
MKALARFFEFEARETNFRREVLAGVATFLTMAYIIFVQPAVLSGALSGTKTGMDFGAVTTATCLSAAVATLIMGLVAKYPVALAPGMGENFFFVLTAIPAAASMGHPEPWRAALGAVFVAGVLFFVISLFGVRRYLLEALSPSMKSGIAVGIGLFIAFIGLHSAGVIQTHADGARLSPKLLSPDMLVFFFGLSLTAALLARGTRGAILWGILGAAGLAAALRLLAEQVAAVGGLAGVRDSMLMERFRWAEGVVGPPPSMAPTFLKMDILAALSWKMLPFVLVFFIMDLFDTMGTLVGVASEAGLMREGKLPRANQAFLADATGTVAGAAMGTSTVTSFIESVAGVEQGGRTGLTAVTVGVLFLAALFFSPVISMVASYPPITAPALVAVGALMMRAVCKIDWRDASEALPAFGAVIGIPLTYSISDGLALALVGYPLVKVLAGRGREVSKTLYVVSAMLLAYLLLIRSRLG